MSESEPSYRRKASASSLLIYCPSDIKDDDDKLDPPRKSTSLDTRYTPRNPQSFHQLKEKMEVELERLHIGEESLSPKYDNSTQLNLESKRIPCTKQEKQAGKGKSIRAPKPEMPLPVAGPPIPPPRPLRNKFMRPINEIIDVLWSVEDYTLKDISTLFKDALPKVVMVTEGHYGYEELDTFGKEQVLLVKGWSRQRRVIAEDDNEVMYSIPIQYPIQMQVVNAEENGATSSMSIAEIEKNFSFPVTARFVEDSEDTYFYSKTMKNVIRMGELKLLDVYKETYFLCHAVNQGVVFDQVLLLPLYVPITLTVAEGFQPTLALDWDHFFNFIRNSTSHVDYGKVYGNLDISAYGRHQFQSEDSNVYEFLQPKSFVKYKFSKEVTESNATRESTVYEALSPPPVPVRTPTTPKENMHFFVDFPDIPKETEVWKTRCNALPSSSSKYVPPSPVHEPILISLPSPGIPISKGKRFVSTDVAKVLPVKRNTVGDDNKHAIVLPSHNAPPPPRPPGPCPEVRFTSLTQIPQDIELLTITDICDCLQLLNLHRYVPKFIEHQIDGKLLKDLEFIMLYEDLGMNRLEATKIMKFACQGWRPQS